PGSLRVSTRLVVIIVASVATPVLFQGSNRRNLVVETHRAHRWIISRAQRHTLALEVRVGANLPRTAAYLRRGRLVIESVIGEVFHRPIRADARALEAIVLIERDLRSRLSGNHQAGCDEQ